MTKFELWCSGWVDICDGLAIILSLGHYCPNWGFRFVCYCVLRKAPSEGNE